MRTMASAGTRPALKVSGKRSQSLLARFSRVLRTLSRHDTVQALDDKMLADIGLNRAFFFANTLAPNFAAAFE